ncbi:MAG: division/cell wall cluster transcriptional repressor MraZ [Chitinophagaceae bacterium]|jgi:MraZ protein|nr:division/cell wall cluster transcriptional repressor MraZ [Chitinophagaceae bacterium]
MIGFLGEYEVTLDAKGRFLLPAGFKKQMPEDWSNQFVISRGIEPCLTLYPMKTWEPIFTQISQLNDFDPKVRNFQRLFLNGATNVDMDTAGRLLIPQNLKDIAEIDKDIVLFAKVKVIEIWDKRKYKQLFETLSANDFSSLANEVMVKPPTV